MKRTLCGLALSALVLALFAPYGTNPREENQEPPMIWMGPGWYYGYYFNNQMQYDSWVALRYNHQNNEEEESS